MADKITESVIKLSADVDEYVGDMNRAAKSNDALAKSADDYAKAEDKKTKVTRQGRDELQQLEARYSQRIRLEQKLQNELERMQRLTAKGAGTEEDRARVFSLVEGSIRRQIADLDKQESAMRKSATSTGLARYEMINLSRQIQDVGVSLAGGQSPFRILVEQGSQIADIFISSKATVKDFFTGIATSIRGLGGGAAALGIYAFVTTLVAGAGAAALAWASAQKDVELALLGIGRASGATAQSINEIAKAGATTFGLSISEAREFASILAQTGHIGVDQLAPAVAMGKNLAIVLGTNSTEAAKILGKALAEPGKGIEQLNQSLGQFDAATVRHVQNLVAQNKILEAQKIIMEGVAQATKNASDAVSNSSQFWTALGNAASNATTKVGEFIAKHTGIGQSSQQQLEGLIAEYQALQRAIEVASPALREALQIKADETLNKIGLINTAMERVGVIAEDTRRKLLSMADQKLVRDVSPEIKQFEDLRNQAEGLRNLLQRIGESGGQGSPILEEMGQTLKQVELSAQRAKEALSSALMPAERLTKEFELSVKSITARTSSERAEVAAQQTLLQLAGQNVSASEKRLAVERAVKLEIERQTQTHKDNMAALEDQLRVASALPGHAQQMAQYQADINSRLREGATLMQAEEEAALKLAAAQEQANRAVDAQIISLRQAVEMERAKMEGNEGAVAAAQAYANAIRSGASETKAAALAAAMLEANLEKAQIAAENMANQMGRAGAMGGDLGAKLDRIGSGMGGAAGWLSPMGPGANLLLTPFRPDRVFGPSPAAPPPPPLTPSSPALTIEFARMAAELAKAMGAPEPEAWTSYQNSLKQAAEGQQQAAVDLQSAAKAQEAAAKAAREATISALDEAVNDIIAAKLLREGLSAQAVNMLIEQGAIQFGTASTRFQTQLDLYKRAGASNTQIAADIRAGIIGEGARPSELLAALDSLTGAVDANTAAQIGLSDFYTQQGDRLVGYRGMNVQTGIRSPIGATAPGASGTGTGGVGAPGGMGGVVNTGGSISYSNTPVGTNLAYGYVWGFVGGKWVPGKYDAAGGWAPLAGTELQTARDTVNAAYAAAGYRNPYQFADGGIMSAAGPVPLRSYQEGGIARGPQMAMFGEAGPEAFVPLKGGAIPVKITGNNDNKPTTIVNINAPLVNFTAEPTRDEVRESAFQAAQMLRRVASG